MNRGRALPFVGLGITNICGHGTSTVESRRQPTTPLGWCRIRVAFFVLRNMLLLYGCGAVDGIFYMARFLDFEDQILLSWSRSTL